MMNILQRVAFRMANALARSAVGRSWVGNLFRLPQTYSARHAETLPAVGAAVRGIAKRLAKLPLDCYRVESDGTERLIPPTDPLANLVGRRWSAHTTRQDGLMHFMRSVLLYGAGGVLVERQGSTPVALHPVDPNGLRREQVGIMRRYYVCLDGRVQTEVPRDDLIFLPFFPPDDGVTDRSPLATHWEAIRAALAATMFAATYFHRGAIPGLIFLAKATLGAKISKVNREFWKVEDEMRRKGHRSMVAPPGYTAMNAGSNAADADLRGARELGVQEVARIYDVPPMLILQDHSRSTYSNIQDAREELAETLEGWANRVSAEISNIIWPKGDYLCRLDTTRLALERFSMRMKAYRDGRDAGVLSANDCRTLEDMEPSEQDGADDLLLDGSPGVTIQASDARNGAVPHNRIGAA